ncbi:hypothetical protein [Bacillus toyonensis]|nr:hypothetical protein [Bacillus toyonensis]
MQLALLTDYYALHLLQGGPSTSRAVDHQLQEQSFTFGTSSA